MRRWYLKLGVSLGLVWAVAPPASFAVPIPGVESDRSEAAPMAWFLLPEHDQEGDYTGGDDEKSGLDEPSDHFTKSVDSLFAAQGSSFDRVVEQSVRPSDGQGAAQPAARKKRWTLSQINADLAISAEGLIGVLALRGQVAIRTFWFRIAEPTPLTPASELFGTLADPNYAAQQAAGETREQAAQRADHEARAHPAPTPNAEPTAQAAAELQEAEQGAGALHQEAVAVPPPDADDPQADATFDAAMSQAQLDHKLSQLSEAAYASGVVRNKQQMFDSLKEAVTEVSDMMSAIPDTGGFAWQPFKFRFAVTVQADGQVTPFMTVGADLRLRLDWRIKPAITPEMAAAAAARVPKVRRAQRAALSMRELVLALSEDLSRVHRQPRVGRPSFHPSYIEFIVGVDAGGQAGLAQGQSGIRGHLYFASLPDLSAQRALAVEPALAPVRETIDLLSQDVSEGQQTVSHRENIGFASVQIGDEKSEGRRYHINRARFRRGLAKAQKIAWFLADRATRSRHSHWAMRQFRTDYELSITGTIGLATVSGNVEIRILYVSDN